MADYRRATKRNQREFIENNRNARSGVYSQPAKSSVQIDMKQDLSGSFSSDVVRDVPRRSGSVPQIPLNKGEIAIAKSQQFYGGTSAAAKWAIGRALSRFNPYLGLALFALEEINNPPIELMPVGGGSAETRWPSNAALYDNGSIYQIGMPPGPDFEFRGNSRYWAPQDGSSPGFAPALQVSFHWDLVSEVGNNHINESGAYSHTQVAGFAVPHWENTGTQWEFSIFELPMAYDNYFNGEMGHYFGGVWTKHAPLSAEAPPVPEYGPRTILAAPGGYDYAAASLPAKGTGWVPFSRVHNMRIPRAAIKAINSVKIALGDRTEYVPETVKNPQTGTGTAITIPPVGPPTVGIGAQYPHPPSKGTKEKKGAVNWAFFQFTRKVFHNVTEYGDLVDALFEALPASARKGVRDDPASKSLALYQHLGEIDINEAVVNVIWNEIEDKIIGKGFQLNQAAARARGDRYGFRTANSINNYGGLDELGELYGQFSKDHVNPTKSQFADYLRTVFGD